jgi:hypothetical protein
MGYDASCTLRVDGTSSRGTAWLEHKDLVFRGSGRLSIPLSSITSATAADGVLFVEFDGRRAEFVIGGCAAKWAARITNPPSRLDKLGVKPGLSVLVLGALDETFVSELEARGARVVRRASKKGESDALFYRADDRHALDRLSELKQSIKPEGALWVVRPKGQKAITESDTMAAGKRAGLVDVKVVSFSDTLTAEKFVIPVAKRLKTSPAKS